MICGGSNTLCSRLWSPQRHSAVRETSRMQASRRVKNGLVLVLLSRAFYVYLSIGLVLLVLVHSSCSFTTKETRSLRWHGLSTTTTTTSVPRYSSFLLSGRKTMEERHLLLSTKTSVENRTAACHVDFGNFWKNTNANFTKCEKPKDTPPTFISKSGSVYWDGEDHVVRFSNHWTGQNGINRIVDCYWSIDVLQDEKKQYLCGKCHYVDFLLPRRNI
jgi:hypothetical protein